LKTIPSFITNDIICGIDQPSGADDGRARRGRWQRLLRFDVGIEN